MGMSLGLSCSVLHFRCPKAAVFNSFSGFLQCLRPHFSMTCAYGCFRWPVLRFSLASSSGRWDSAMRAQPCYPSRRSQQMCISTFLLPLLRAQLLSWGAIGTPGAQGAGQDRLQHLPLRNPSTTPFPTPTGADKRQAAYSHKHLRQKMFK